MGALKVLRLWLNAYLVLFYGVCFAQARTAGTIYTKITLKIILLFAADDTKEMRATL